MTRLGMVFGSIFQLFQVRNSNPIYKSNHKNSYIGIEEDVLWAGNFPHIFINKYNCDR